MSDLFDWKALNNIVSPEKGKLVFEENKHLFKKVAFDVYKRMGSQTDKLWELRTDEDGKQYLFALYDVESEDGLVSTASLNKWSAIADKEGKGITLSYNKIPVYRFSSEMYKFAADEAASFAKFVEEKANDPKWVNSFIERAPDLSEAKKTLVKKLIQGD